ncbi:MAG: hypothetical protein SGPRY_010020 [Prymnesium sp.]
MQDGIEQAFEDLLSWDTFSLRLNNSLAQIDNLDRTIAAIPEERTKVAPSLMPNGLTHSIFLIFLASLPDLPASLIQLPILSTGDAQPALLHMAALSLAAA